MVRTPEPAGVPGLGAVCPHPVNTVASPRSSIDEATHRIRFGIRRRIPNNAIPATGNRNAKLIPLAGALVWRLADRAVVCTVSVPVETAVAVTGSDAGEKLHMTA